jgi:hypothetical protein
MNIYTVLGVIDYEYGHVIGAFHDEPAAVACAANFPSQDDSHLVEVWEPGATESKFVCRVYRRAHRLSDETGLTKDENTFFNRLHYEYADGRKFCHPYPARAAAEVVLG